MQGKPGEPGKDHGRNAEQGVNAHGRVTERREQDRGKGRIAERQQNGREDGNRGRAKRREQHAERHVQQQRLHRLLTGDKPLDEDDDAGKRPALLHDEHLEQTGRQHQPHRQ